MDRYLLFRQRYLSTSGNGSVFRTMTDGGTHLFYRLSVVTHCSLCGQQGQVSGLTRAPSKATASHQGQRYIPTAWTPLYSQAPDVTAERNDRIEADLQPGLVAPVVVTLARRSVPFTGEVVGAAGGHLSRIYVAQTQGLQLDASLETVMESFAGFGKKPSPNPMGLVVAAAVRGSTTTSPKIHLPCLPKRYN